jgi:hypothetical protein
MKKISILLAMILAMGVLGCQKEEVKKEPVSQTSPTTENVIDAEISEIDSVKIELSNGEILVDGEKISEDKDAAVYKANDIIFYLEGQGIEYGAGKKRDEHSQIEGDAHTVIYITEPGTYELSGSLDAGQIFVDLGDGTKKDEEAVANIILNNVDISCTVAPAIIFYRTYECDYDTEAEDAKMDVDTSEAGANLILAEGSKNKIYGSYVAEIYEECELNEDGTEVIDSKKLHKFDGAIYSRRTMNILGTGSLLVTAENEGICSEKHMTIYGGDISIVSGNDGINVSDDQISVFAMHDGQLNIHVTGETGEGDGIDSNGWLVINGGIINTSSCATSKDAGVDANHGIFINGGLVTATGTMEAELAKGKQTAVSFASMNVLESGKTYEVKDEEENVVMKVAPQNPCTTVVVSSAELRDNGNYSLWLDDTLIAE